jgi:hypothetical protein
MPQPLSSTGQREYCCTSLLNSGDARGEGERALVDNRCRMGIFHRYACTGEKLINKVAIVCHGGATKRDETPAVQMQLCRSRMHDRALVSSLFGFKK